MSSTDPTTDTSQEQPKLTAELVEAAKPFRRAVEASLPIDTSNEKGLYLWDETDSTLTIGDLRRLARLLQDG